MKFQLEIGLYTDILRHMQQKISHISWVTLPTTTVWVHDEFNYVTYVMLNVANDAFDQKL